MGSMHTGLEEHPQGTERLAAFYRERVQGGVALIVTGGIAPNAKVPWSLAERRLNMKGSYLTISQ